jgi:hypothetical protein
MKAKFFGGLLLVVVGFVVGMLAQYSTNRQLERDLLSTRQQLATYQGSSQLWQLRDSAALLALEAARSNYGTAGEYSTRFFDQVRDLASHTSDANLKSGLQEILNTRDKITAGIAKQDPAVVSEIETLVAKVHGDGSH